MLERLLILNAACCRASFLFWMRIIMMKNRKQTDREARRGVSTICISGLLCDSVKSGLPTLHIFNKDTTGFTHGVWLLGMPSAFILHINIRCSAHRGRGSMCLQSRLTVQRQTVRRGKGKSVSQNTDVKADWRHKWEKKVVQNTEKSSRSAESWRQISVRVVSMCCRFIARLRSALKSCLGGEREDKKIKKGGRQCERETHHSSWCLLGGFQSWWLRGHTGAGCSVEEWKQRRTQFFTP